MALAAPRPPPALLTGTLLWRILLVSALLVVVSWVAVRMGEGQRRDAGRSPDRRGQPVRHGRAVLPVQAAGH